MENSKIALHVHFQLCSQGPLNGYSYHDDDDDHNDAYHGHDHCYDYHDHHDHDDHHYHDDHHDNASTWSPQ